MTPMRGCGLHASGSLLLLLLFGCCTASEKIETRKIYTFAGDTVILPCQTYVSDPFPTVEWSKEGLGQNLVFLYRDRCVVYEMMDPAYWYRAHHIKNKLKNGNISLSLSSVQLSDAGIYTCRTIRKKKVDVTWELIVGSVSDPELSVLPADNAGATVFCKAKCWHPKPEMLLLDDRGKNILAEKAISEDPRGCSTITMRATLQPTTRRVVCRVHEPKMSQTRETEIYIPDTCSCTLFIVIAVAATLLLCGLICCGVVICMFYSRCGNKEGQQCNWFCRPCHQTAPGRSDVIYHHPVTQTEGDESPTTELQRTIQDLMFDLEAKDKIVNDLRQQLDEAKLVRGLEGGNRQQGNNNGPELEVSPQSPDVNHDILIPVPALSPLAQGSTHNQSCPALLTSTSPVPLPSYSISAPEGGNVFRTMSLSLPSQKVPRAKRRYTTSVVFNSPSKALSDVLEDKEPLVYLD